jgi:signal transduction histidine kinase
MDGSVNGAGNDTDDATLRAQQAADSAAASSQHALVQGLAHDLRAPLRAIDSFASLLGKQLQQGAVDESSRDYLQRIRDAATRMAGLLDALQELTAAGRATLRDDDVDLSLLAEWIGAEMRDRAPGREARIDVAPGLAARGDEHYLKRMLARLMDNAWVFSASRPEVEIAVEGERVGDVLHLRVRDRGIGFDPRYAERLFEPFGRLHGVDEGAGAGLGLAVAQCIAHRHGGRIHAESQLGEGSVFHVELPVRPRAEPELARGLHAGGRDG